MKNFIFCAVHVRHVGMKGTYFSKLYSDYLRDTFHIFKLLAYLQNHVIKTVPSDFEIYVY